jgi:hypothetical protein
MKYLKGDINSGAKTKKIKDQVMGLLSSRTEGNESKTTEFKQVVPNTTRGSIGKQSEVKLFREYLQKVKNDIKCTLMKNEHPYFIINPRLHSDEMLNDPILMNSIFKKNVDRFRLNTDGF